MLVNLDEVLSTTPDKKVFRLLLNGIVTQNEKIMMAKRLLIQLMLIHNYSLKQIQEIVKVSVSTIHSQKHLLIDNPEYVTFLRSIFAKYDLDTKEGSVNNHPIIKFFDYLDNLSEGRRHRSKLYY